MGRTVGATGGARPRGPAVVGLLYPGYAAEDDFFSLAARAAAPAIAEVVHTSVGEDAHRVDALLDLGAPERLAAGVQRLAAARPDAVMWACTSGSFVFGWEGARAQVSALAGAAGVPTSSTSFAFVAALDAIGAARVSVVATYPREVADHFVGFLEAGGVDVLALHPLGIPTAAEAGAVEGKRVLAATVAGDHHAADALVLPDTALHTAGILEELEAAVGKPVLTANQVTFWCGLALAGRLRPQDGLGTCFRRPAPPTLVERACGARPSTTPPPAAAPSPPRSSKR